MAFIANIKKIHCNNHRLLIIQSANAGDNIAAVNHNIYISINICVKLRDQIVTKKQVRMKVVGS